MIQRTVTQKLIEASKQFAVVSVTGPRQAGKTTLCKATFPDHEYINLENLASAERIQADPISFINGTESGVIIDEIQKLPELLSYIQVAVDENFKPGQFIVTGSQNLLMSEKIGQTLAGRVATFNLLPLSIAELETEKLTSGNVDEQILKGFYPAIYERKQDADLFYSSYINTYVERDVRDLKQIGDLSQFRRFLQLISGRIGNLVNLSKIGNEIGLDHKTVNSWLSVLEASYVIFRLQPYYENFGKRAIKSPKLYFYDVGLASYLLGINTSKELSSHTSRGALFENMIILEFLKAQLATKASYQCYFWRDNKNHEIDLLIDLGSKKIPIEIKSSATFNKNFLKNINFLLQTTSNAADGAVVYAGEETGTIQGIQLVSWQDTSSILLQEVS